MKSKQRLVDWIGFVCTLVFAIALWRRNAVLGVLLAPTLLYELITAASFLLRSAPKAKSTSLAARLSAYGVTVLVPAYFSFAPQTHIFAAPPALRSAGVALWLGSGIFGIWTAWTLRYSFSIEPQARRVVADGPYRWLRHPMYAAYVVQYVSVLIRRPSYGFAFILAAWSLLLFVRIGFEERVLTSVFPVYSEYRRQVGLFLPRWRKRSAGTVGAAIPAVEAR